MTLLLDTRQRAMLQAMGITLWSPEPTTYQAHTAHAGAAAKTQTPHPTASKPRQHSAAHTPPVATTGTAHAAHHAGTASPAPSAQHRMAGTRTAPPAAIANGNPAHSAAHATGWVLHPPQQLFPAPAAQAAPHALVTAQVRQARWLIVAQNASPAQPLTGDWGTLLGNMLLAMGLHQHPDAWICTLEAPLSAALMPAGDARTNTPPDITEAVTQLAPNMVLLLGAAAARAALGNDRGSAPLGQLRGHIHTVGGCPAVVTFDPSFLLRSTHNKAGAWADLCMALAHINGTPIAPAAS